MDDDYVVNKEIADEVGIEAALLYSYVKKQFIKKAVQSDKPFSIPWVGITDAELLKDLSCLSIDGLGKLKRKLEKNNMIAYQISNLGAHSGTLYSIV